MIVKSLVTDEKYIWLRVPRTATYAYGKLFFPNGGYQHKHNSYYHETDTYGNLPAFSVVRNPYTRFVSSLKYMTKKQNLNNKVGIYNFNLPTENTNTLCNFLKNNLCKLKDIDSNEKYKEVFQTNDISYIKLFFRNQKDFIDFPGVKIFRYECLSEYNSWIESELGYDTSKITVINNTDNELGHINFQSVEFIKLTEELFYDDYKVFNYPFQHLT